MSKKENCLVYSKNTNLAYEIREKLKESGYNINYIQDIKEIFKFLISEKTHLIVTTENLELYCDVFEIYSKNVYKNFSVIYVSDEKLEGNINNNYYICSMSKFDLVLPLVLKKPDNREVFSAKIPDEVIYKYTTEILISHKFSPTMQGYNYLMQCILVGVKCGDTHINLSQYLYKEVSKISNVSVASVEKSIRIIIKKTLQMYPQIFDNAELIENKITNSSVINYFIIQVKLRFINTNFK